jgi:hypothetical protein
MSRARSWSMRLSLENDRGLGAGSAGPPERHSHGEYGAERSPSAGLRTSARLADRGCGSVRSDAQQHADRARLSQQLPPARLEEQAEASPVSDSITAAAAATIAARRRSE